MHYSVCDTETTVRNVGEGAVGSFGGAPFCPKNFIVSIGELHDDGNYRYSYSVEGVHPLPSFLRRATHHPTMVVGHNLGFDWHYFMKHWPEEMEAALHNLYIWDTQQVEYLLSGQSELYPSLDECSARRGLPLKDDKIKEYWNQGVDTVFIPKDELLDYMKQDVYNTHGVFLDQYEKVMADPSLRELVYVKMDDLLSTIQMTWNGMKFDLQLAMEKLEPLDKERDEAYNILMGVAKDVFPEDIEFDPESPQQISMLLFGGVLKNKEPVVQKDEQGVPLRYKSGQKAGEVKTRIETIERKIKGIGLKPGDYDIPQVKSGHFSTNEEFLEKISHPFVTTLLRFRTLTKDTETYYRGYSKFVWFDGCIHPNINQESTRTGRQSSSNPNLQNVTKDDDD